MITWLMARFIDLKKNASSFCRERKNYKHKNRERKNYKHTAGFDISTRQLAMASENFIWRVRPGSHSPKWRV